MASLEDILKMYGDGKKDESQGEEQKEAKKSVDEILGMYGGGNKPSVSKTATVSKPQAANGNVRDTMLKMLDEQFNHGRDSTAGAENTATESTTLDSLAPWTRGKYDYVAEEEGRPAAQPKVTPIVPTGQENGYTSSTASGPPSPQGEGYGEGTAAAVQNDAELADEVFGSGATPQSPAATAPLTQGSQGAATAAGTQSNQTADSLKIQEDVAAAEAAYRAAVLEHASMGTSASEEAMRAAEKAYNEALVQQALSDTSWIEQKYEAGMSGAASQQELADQLKSLREQRSGLEQMIKQATYRGDTQWADTYREYKKVVDDQIKELQKSVDDYRPETRLTDVEEEAVTRLYNDVANATEQKLDSIAEICGVSTKELVKAMNGWGEEFTTMVNSLSRADKQKVSDLMDAIGDDSMLLGKYNTVLGNDSDTMLEALGHSVLAGFNGVVGGVAGAIAWTQEADAKIAQFFGGDGSEYMENAVHDYEISHSFLEERNNLVRKAQMNAGDVQRVATDLVENGTEMLPDMIIGAIGAATGLPIMQACAQNLALGFMGVRVYGSTNTELVNFDSDGKVITDEDGNITASVSVYDDFGNKIAGNDVSFWRRSFASAATAGIEVLTEKMFNGLGGLYGKGLVKAGKLGKVAEKELFDYFQERMLASISNAALKPAFAAILSIGFGGLGEGLEETVAGIAEVPVNLITMTKDTWLANYGIDESHGWIVDLAKAEWNSREETGYSTLIGFLMGMIGSAGSAINAYGEESYNNAVAAAEKVNSFLDGKAKLSEVITDEARDLFEQAGITDDAQIDAIGDDYLSNMKEAATEMGVEVPESETAEETTATPQSAEPTAPLAQGSQEAMPEAPTELPTVERTADLSQMGVEEIDTKLQDELGVNGGTVGKYEVNYFPSGRGYSTVSVVDTETGELHTKNAKNSMRTKAAADLIYNNERSLEKYGDKVHSGNRGRQSAQSGRGRTEAVQQQTDTVSQRDTARARQSKAEAAGDYDVKTAKELAGNSGLESAYNKVIPEQDYDDELKAVDSSLFEQTGKHPTFILGQIQIDCGDGRIGYVSGVRTDGGIVIQADSVKKTAEQIANHEHFHDLVAEGKVNTNDMLSELIGNVMTQEQANEILDKYAALYSQAYGTEDAAEDALEELCADLYGGINGRNGAQIPAEAMSAAKDYVSGTGKYGSSQQAQNVQEDTGPPKKKDAELKTPENDQGEYAKWLFGQQYGGINEQAQAFLDEQMPNYMQLARNGAPIGPLMTRFERDYKKAYPNQSMFGETTERELKPVGLERLNKSEPGDKPVDIRRMAQRMPAGAVLGKKGTTYTNDNTAVKFNYAVYPADTLVASTDINGNINEAYPQEFQPRDRSRAFSQIQMAKISKTLNPERLGASAEAQTGAPIVRADGVVIGGNGRTVGIQTAYSKGRAGEYSAYIKEHAAEFGIDPKSIPENPVLVRVTESKNYAQLAKDLNAQTTQAMSATEQAESDADIIRNISSLYKTDENGKLSIKNNRDFIAAFTKGIPETERNTMTTADGQKLSATGRTRIVNALFQAAYGDPDLTAALAEDEDSNGRNIINGLRDAAPSVIDLNAAMDAGNLYSADISKWISEAVEIYQNAKGNGLTLGSSAGQISMDSDEGPGKAIAVFFEKNARSAKQIREYVNALGEALEAYGKPITSAEDSLFGGTEDVQITVSDLFNRAAEIYGENTGNAVGFAADDFIGDAAREALTVKEAQQGRKVPGDSKLDTQGVRGRGRVNEKYSLDEVEEAKDGLIAVQNNYSGNISPESGSIRFSLEEAQTIEDRSMAYYEAHPAAHISSRMLNDANKVTANLVEHMKPFLNVMNNKGKRYLPEEILGKTTFSNGSYGKTIENTTICFRTLSYIDFTNEIKEQLGRPLTVEESFLASQMLYDIAKEPQCLYCYVSLDRKAYDGFLLNYTQQRDAAMEAYRWADIDPDERLKPQAKRKSDRKSAKYALGDSVLENIYRDYLDGREDTPNQRERFNMWIEAEQSGEVIGNEDLTTEEKRSKIKNEDTIRAKQIKDAEAYAQGASWAKKLEQYRAYNSDILSMSPQTVKKLNAHYGLRFYSFSEYTAAFIAENMQQIRDAAIKGLYGLAYTKKTDFARIFGKTGMNINISCFGRMDGGEVVADTLQGADWNEVQELREKYPNVGAVFVATNDEMVEWALAQDWIDVVIPFHIVRTGANVAEFYKWVNNTKDQADVDANGRNKTISPAEFHNDRETYFKLIQQRGLTPRFAKWAENPNYMKLVNETRQSDRESGPLKPIYDEDAAIASFDQFVEDGGYYGDWYEDGKDYDAAVKQVVNDIKTGKRANEVDYGRQDFDKSIAMKNRAKTANRQHMQKFSLDEVDIDNKAGKAYTAELQSRIDEAVKMQQAGKYASEIYSATHLMQRPNGDLFDPENGRVVYNANERGSANHSGDVRGMVPGRVQEGTNKGNEQGAAGGLLGKPNRANVRRKAYDSLSSKQRERLVKALDKEIKTAIKKSIRLGNEANAEELQIIFPAADLNNLTERVYRTLEKGGAGIETMLGGIDYDNLINQFDKISGFIGPKYSLDEEYESLAENPDENRAQLEHTVSKAAANWSDIKTERGKPIELYHGTGRFGFTKYDMATKTASEGMIYATTKREVAANYAGRDHYAGVRDIGKKLRSGNSTADVIFNAKQVLERKYHVVSQAEREAIVGNITKQGLAIADKLNDLFESVAAIPGMQDENTTVSFTNEWGYEQSTELYQAVDAVEGLIWAITGDDVGFDEDGNVPDYVIDYLKSDIDRFEKWYEPLRNYLIDNWDSIKGTQAEEAANLIKGYEMHDLFVDAKYTLLPTLTENELLSAKKGSVASVDAVRNAIEMNKDIGAYRFYGNTGGNLLTVDGKGRDWLVLECPEMDDKYHSTDTIAKWARNQGYTSVLFKNVTDGGMHADEYVFFQPNQVKSADPVTYDDSGNVIPLSERFNDAEKDFRYSLDEVSESTEDKPGANLDWWENYRQSFIKQNDRDEFRGTANLAQLGINIAGNEGIYDRIESLKNSIKALRSVKAATSAAEKRVKASYAETTFAKGIASGIYTEADIPSTFNVNKVTELADFYFAEQGASDKLMKKQKALVNKKLDQKMYLLMGEGKVKNLPKSYKLNFRTPLRSMREIFGDKAGQEIYNTIFAPVEANTAERDRFRQRMYNAVEKFTGEDGKQSKLNKQESALVMAMIENEQAAILVKEMETGTAVDKRQATAIRDAVKNIQNGQSIGDALKEWQTDERTKRTVNQLVKWEEAQKLIKDQKLDTVKLENAAKTYQAQFASFYDAINDLLAAHGYEPIGFIKGYAPHMQEEHVQTALQKAMEFFGITEDVTNLPTEIAGMTANFRPNKRWNPYFLQRNGEAAKQDIVAAYESYVDYMSDVIYHMDDIMRVRAFERYFRETYSDDNVRDRIEEAKTAAEGTLENKTRFLRDLDKIGPEAVLDEQSADDMIENYIKEMYQQFKEHSVHGPLVTWLTDYANNLAAKQLSFDRGGETFLGRKYLNVSNKLTQAFATSQVGGKLSSVLNQGAQLPMIYAELGGKYTARAMKDFMFGRLKSGGWSAQSDFLVTKMGVDSINPTLADMVVDKMFIGAEFVDTMMSTLAVRGRYLKGLDEGLSHKDAMKAADRFGSDIMGSRAKGTKPLAFASKDPIKRMLTMFQIEALNSWDHVISDLPHDFREIEEKHGRAKAASALAGVILKSLIASFLMNRLDDEIYGGTPAPFDLLGLSANFVASGNGLRTNDLMAIMVNNMWKRATGEELFEGIDDSKMSDGKFNTTAAFKELGENVVNDVPLVRNIASLLGWGDSTLPFAGSGVNALVDKLMGEKDGKSWAETLRAFALGYVPGGSQIERTIQGAEALREGGVYSSSGKLKYALDNQDPWTIARVLAFGKYANPEAQRYYADIDFSGKTGNALSETQQRAFDIAAGAGVRTTTAEQTIRDVWATAKELSSSSSVSKDAAKAALKDADISNELKAVLWQCFNKSWSGKDNPFDTKIGTKVKAAFDAGDDLSGLSLPGLD